MYVNTNRGKRFLVWGMSRLFLCESWGLFQSSRSSRTSPSHHDEEGRRSSCCWPDVTVRKDYRYVMHNLPATINCNSAALPLMIRVKAAVRATPLLGTEQDRQCTYKRNHYCSVKAISITHCDCVLVAWGIQHALLMCRIRPIVSYVDCLVVPYFSTLSRKRHDFRKNLLYIKSVLWFSLQHLANALLILRRNQRDKHKCTQDFMWSAPYSCQILMNLAFALQTFQKYSNIKFNENPSSGSTVIPCGRTDRWSDGQTWRS